jgi:hypothetical protein
MNESLGMTVTECEWLECDDPEVLLEFLWHRARPSNRKLRLFACACYRRIWPLLTEDRHRAAVETAERYADDLATRKELDRARRDSQDAPIRAAATGHFRRQVELAAAETAAWAATQSQPGSALTPALAPQWLAWQAAESSLQAQLLHDIAGNPFRPVTFETARLTPQAATLARAIYEERRFTDLPVLADALEEGGCTQADLLGHLRSDGQHARGCWALDLVLGNE